MPWPGRCARSAVSNGPCCSSSTGSQIRRSDAVLNKVRPETRSPAPCFHRHGEIRDRTFENQRYGASGLNLTIAAIILWNTIYLGHAVAELRAQAETLPISCSPTLPRSAGSTSASMATTSGHPSRSSGGFGRCEIRAPPSSMPLSARFGTDSAMTPIMERRVRFRFLAATNLPFHRCGRTCSI